MGWQIEQCHLWVDFFSICQEDKSRQQAGVASLLAYIAVSDAYLVPAMHGFEDDKFGKVHGFFTADVIQGFGNRAWCRLEAFTAWCIALLRGREGALFAMQPNDDTLWPLQYEFHPEQLPSG